MLDNELKSKVKLLWNKFWSGGISDPLVAIKQMTYLIYMKQLEDEDTRKMQEAQLTNKKYNSIFTGYNDCKWSEWKGLPANEILEHVRDKVFPFLRSLGEEESPYSKYMKHESLQIPTPSLLIEAVKIIDSLKIKDQNRDTRGDLYEYLLSELTTSGKNGQFRTPRHIIQMMVELTRPKKDDVICDPSCGTAGFLVNAYEYILKSNTSKDQIKIDEEGNEYNFVADKLKESDWEKIRSVTFHGYDFDRTMIQISLMNMMMHGITRPDIEQINTLSNSFGKSEEFSLILANPPFKGSIDENDINQKLTVKTKKTELLFIELIYKLLEISGRAAVIVPDGVLFGASNAHKQIRKILLEDCKLEGLISMPSGVFKPYAGVSTGVLVFTKGEPTKKVWFYDMENDGFSLDDKRNKIGDGKGDIPDIIKRFHNREKEEYIDRKGKAFFVPVEEIIKNDYDLSIQKYKEFQFQEEKYEEPKIILKKIETLEKEILEGLKELKV
ncbi:MAG: N-6 DNA methylase [Candidatus ainarchaeum sp.]|nr:N-6 DNA methylase [Candidatus ainarchaeum sp.]